MKKIITIFTLINFFSVFSGLQGFANENNLKKTINESSIYILDNNVFNFNSINEKNLTYLNNNIPFFSIKSESLESENKIETHNSLWIASIFVPSLGQILMGDTLRGLKFPLIMFLGSISIFLIFYRSMYDGLGILIGASFSLVFILIIHIWNVIDAFILSKKKGNLIFEYNDDKK
ncbi:MAG: hypothetical protein AABZ74_11000 [Cyanobacteriota bacterium]